MSVHFDHLQFTQKIAAMLDFNSDCELLDNIRAENPNDPSLSYLGRSFDITVWRFFVALTLLHQESKIMPTLYSEAVSLSECMEECAHAGIVEEQGVILEKLLSQRIVERFPDERFKSRERYILVGTSREFCVFAKDPPLSVGLTI